MRNLAIAAALLALAICGCGKPEEPTPAAPPQIAAIPKAEQGTAPGSKTNGKPGSPTASAPLDARQSGTQNSVPSTGTTTGTGASAESRGHSKSELAGVWKVDVAHTTLPAPTPEAKAEQAHLRLKLNKDGTYAMTGAGAETGHWAVEGDTLALTSTKDGPRPPFTISSDSKQLAVVAADKKIIVLIKA